MKQAFPITQCVTILCLTGAMTVLSATTPTTTVLNVPSPASAMNAAITLTATVTPNTVTGNVTFYDGATIVGTASVTAGAAVLNYRPFFAGARVLRAYYQGSLINSPSFSPVTNLTVQPTVEGSFGNIQFAPAYSATSSPVIGDFNNDGAPDTAVLVSNGSVELLLKTVNAYSSSVPITGLNAPGGMVPGDFNSDGNLDLAVADTSNSQIVVYFGNGDGTFQSGVAYSTTTACSAIAAGDFNGDGVVDLATANGSDGLSLFINNGDGTFQAAVNSADPGTLFGLAAGDFNGDGIADLAIANTSSGTIDIVLGGVGGFSAPVAYSVTAPVALTLADVNGDHILDLAAVSEAMPFTNVAVLLGNGDGTFQLASTVASDPSSPVAIASGDLDGDGIVDLATTGPNSFCASIGKGDGTFYSQYCIPGGYGVGLAVGAIDLYGRTGVDVASNAQIVFIHGGDNPPVVATGSQQSLSAGSSAPIPLKIQLTDFGRPYPLAGTLITFTAPSLGPGGYFSGLGDSVTVATLADGTATAPSFVSNSALGSYSVTATTTYDSTSFSLGNAPLTIGPATCSFTVSPPAVIFNSDGGTSPVTVVSNPSSCAWSVSSDSPWIAPSATDFTGTGNVSITVPPNLSASLNTGNLVVAGQYIPVMQWATAPVVADATATSFPGPVTDMLGYGFSAGCSAVPLDYCPDDSITRAEAAILLVRAVYGSDNFSFSTTPHFNDVDVSAFGFKWIQKLFELGITTGCGSSNYCPDQTLPRDQAAVLVIRSRLGATTPFDNPSNPFFADVPLSAFGFASIQRLRLENITSGCTATTFCPSRAVTRGELAAFIMRGLTNQFLPTGTALISEVFSAGRNLRFLNPFSTTTLILSGQNTHFGLTSTIVVAGGITTSNFTVYSPTYATVDVIGDNNTLLDVPESIIVTTDGEEAVIPNPILFENDCG